MSGKKSRFLRLALICAAAIAIQTGPGRAGSTEGAIALCERAIKNGTATGSVPEGVLHAISLTETGRMQNGRLRPWPWAINREGKGHWFTNRAEALAFARQSVAEGRTSFDVGCFQINYRWHGDKFSSVESMFDPDTGANYAAKFLTGLRQETGSWSAAAGAYHSRTPKFASKYRARFDRILANLNGKPIVVAKQSDAVEVVRPGKSRTKMAKQPLIITVSGGNGTRRSIQVASADTQTTRKTGRGIVVVSKKRPLIVTPETLNP
jgi:hypothetical protein